MNLLKSLIKNDVVEFFCDKEDFGVIPPPIPARNFMPDWYKNLSPHIDKKVKIRNSTIKRCAPFLDAMTTGWIIPLAADVEFTTNNTAGEINYKWSFYKTMVEGHSKEQISSNDNPNPNDPKPPLKFLNYILIKIPKGYSALFVPPLNRPDPRFTCLSGMVDDGYMGQGNIEYINFPFFFNQLNYTGIIKAGTPLVQMILIERNQVLRQSRKAELQPMSDKETKLLETTRKRHKSHESMYRDNIWERK
jgi:hypothetical protein